MNENQKVIQLQNVFLRLEIPFQQAELEEFAALFKPQEYKKGEILQKAGSEEAYLGYITKGLVRFFYTNEDGKEFNQTFKCEHQIYSNYFKTFLNEPAPFAIQALEDTETLVANYNEIAPFYDRSPTWERLGRKITELNFMYKAIRERDLLTHDASTRLNNFYQYFPELKNRISKHHLALYLGINPASLSRLLKKTE